MFKLLWQQIQMKIEKNFTQLQMRFEKKSTRRGYKLDEQKKQWNKAKQSKEHILENN